MGHDLSELVARRPDLELSPLSANDIDVVAILCGCPRACGNRPDVRARAKRCLLVSDGTPTDIASLEAALVAAVHDKYIRSSG